MDRAKNFPWLTAGLLAISGCSTSILCKESQIRHHRNVHPTAVGEVKTGGELHAASSFPTDVNRTLTLRQAILQSGGIRRQEATLEHVVSFLPGTQKRAHENREDADARSIETLKAILADEVEVNQLLGSELEARLAGFNQRRNYRAPIGESIVEYLQAATEGIATTLAFTSTTTVDVNMLDPKSTDRSKLIQGLQYAFQESAHNHPEFATHAIQRFNELSHAWSSEELAVVSNAEPTMSVPDYQTVHRSTKTIPLLVGLENARGSYLHRNTIYFHPDIVFTTAIGDIPLRDGDFVFAIRAEDTSLPRMMDVSHIWSVPVLGVSDAASAIDPIEFKNISRVVDLKIAAIQDAEQSVTMEDICILKRHSSGTVGSQSFYFPVRQSTVSHTPVPLGTIAPGDSFLFAYASRCPLVLERMLAPAKDRLEQRQTEVRANVECRSQMPAEGRYLSKLGAHWNYYTRPLATGAKRLINSQTEDR